jgi:hypothetical protein
MHGHSDCPRLGTAVLVSPGAGRLGERRSPARFLREFVDQLDLGSLGFAMPVSVEGRPR